MVRTVGNNVAIKHPVILVFPDHIVNEENNRN